MTSSVDAAYADRLRTRETVWWKRVLDVQRPYRRHLRRLRLGYVLDVGCGVGRNLVNLGGAGTAIGVDPNPDAIEVCRARGLLAFTPDEFAASEHSTGERFDALLVAHVLEHVPHAEAVALVKQYLRYVRAGGRAVLITPQEAGYRSDPTHVELVDFDGLAKIIAATGLEPIASYSFPFPRLAGRVFRYNEFVAIARKP